MVLTVKFLRNLGVKRHVLLKVLKTKPVILTYSVDGKFQPNVKFLESIQIRLEDIGKLVTRHPQLLTVNVERILKLIVNYFLDLGFTK
jgi:mTERF domain-containing protein